MLAVKIAFYVVFYTICLVIGWVIGNKLVDWQNNREFNKNYEDAVSRLRHGRKRLAQDPTNKEIIAYVKQAENDFVQLFY